jgi:putative lipoic acid-binding regulatory protein
MKGGGKMRYISFEILLKALESDGIDAVYERLSDLFMEDLYLNKLNKEVERHEE